MRFHRLLAQGLIGIERVDLDFDALPQTARTVAIVGENGAGKSSTAQALFAALYLDFPDHAGSLADQFRNGRGRLELLWSYSGQSYRSVVKVGGSTEAYLYAIGADGQEEPITPSGSVKAYKAAIVERLMPRAESLATWFAPQKKDGAFHELSRSEKRDFIVRRLAVEILQTIATLAAERAKELGRRIDELTARIEEIRRQQAALPGLRETLDNEQAALELVLADLQAQADLVLEIERRAASLAQELDGRDRLETDLAGLESDRQRRRDRYDELADAIDAEEVVLARRTEIEAAGADIVTVETDLAAIQLTLTGRRAELEELQARLIEAGKVRAVIAAKERERDALIAEARGAHQATIAAADARGKAAEAALREARKNLVAAASLDALKRAEDQVCFRKETLADAQRFLAQTAARAGLIEEVGCAKIQSLPLLQEGCLLLEDARQGRDQVADLERNVAGIEAAVQGTIERLEAIRIERDEAIGKAQAAVATAEAALVSAEEARSQIPAALSADKAVTAIEAEIVELTASLTSYGCDANVAILRQEIAQVAKAEKTLQDRLTALRALAAQAPLVAAAERRIEDLNRESAQVLAEGTALKERIEALQAEIAELAAKASEARRRQDEAEQAARRRTELETAAGTAREAVGRRLGAIETLEALTAELEAAGAECSELMDKKAVWEHLAIAFGPEGIQALKIDAAGPQVEQLVKSLLEECYGSRFAIQFQTQRILKGGGTSDKEFDIRVLDAEKPTALIGEKSGGERVILGEALSLALSLFGSLRAGARVEEIIRDEADGALSSDRAQAYFEMLCKAVELGHLHRVYFITHRAEIAEQADARLCLRNGVFSVG